MTIEIHVHDDDNPQVVIVFPNGKRFCLNADGRLKQWEESDDLLPGQEGRWRHLYGKVRNGW